MSSDFVAMAAAEFGVVPREAGGWLESRSGAAVRAVRTSDGRPAYLKATPATAGRQVLADARRELRFYLDLAPVVPVRTPRLLGWSEAGGGVAVLLAAAGEVREAGSWTVGMWSRLGRDLAALHAMPQPREAGWDVPDRLRAALADPNLDQISAFWSPALPQLVEFVARRDETAEQFGSVPPAFIHGDCHTGNIVTKPAGWPSATGRSPASGGRCPISLC
jgi:aminoglycoside phosphotransferase (APT) family kinase protein